MSVTEHIDQDTDTDKTNKNTFTKTTRVSNAIDSKRFSSLTKLINVTAYVIKFISNIKKKITGSNEIIYRFDILERISTSDEVMDTR